MLTGPGYTSIKAQLLSVPPYAAAALLTVAIGFIADHTRQRGITNMLISVIAMVGFALMMGAKSPGARYAGTYLGAMGIYPTISNTISWCSNNTEGEGGLSFLSSLSVMLTVSPNRCIQARCHVGFLHRLGKPQWYCLLEHLPRPGRADLLSWSWYCSCISGPVPVRWIVGAVHPAAAGEPQAPAWRARQLG